MKKRRYAWLSVIFFMLLLSTTACEKKTGFKKEYKLQVNVGGSTYWGMGAAKFSELAKQKTNGRINIKPYYGSQLLKGAQLNSPQMVAGGAIDCAFESTINTEPVIPGLNIFSLPFFINTFENLDKLEAGKTGEIIFAKMREKGLEPLAWGENGFRQLTNSKRPVKTPKDLAGLRIRVVGSKIFTEIFRALGADPINMNWGDAITAFQQGAVDGQENPAGILTAVQIHQYNHYGAFWNYLADPLILYWNKQQWDAFPDDIKKAISEAAVEAARFEKALTRAGLDDGASLSILEKEFNYHPEIPDPVKFLEKKGMEIISLSPENRVEFKKAVEPVVKKWTSIIGQEAYQAAVEDMK